jgi:hypothetical protein
MKTFCFLVWSCVVVGALPLAAQRAQKPELTSFLIADRNAEIRLARSAAPPSISDSATVLVLERTGYVQAVRGSNGFTCVVIRSLAGDLEAPGLWSPRISAPHCLNAAATRSVLPTLLKQTEWLLSGENAATAAAHLARSYANRELSPPANGAMAYTLSPEQVLDEHGLRGLPHLIFFFMTSRSRLPHGAQAPSALR